MTTLVEITSSYITVGDFDSRRRYVRRYVGTGSPFYVPLGFTIAIGNAGNVARFHYDVGGYVVDDGSATVAFTASTVQAVI